MQYGILKAVPLQEIKSPTTCICNAADPKWRFFWRVGERPECGEFSELNVEPVVPQVCRLAAG